MSSFKLAFFGGRKSGGEIKFYLGILYREAKIDKWYLD